MHFNWHLPVLAALILSKLVCASQTLAPNCHSSLVCFTRLQLTWTRSDSLNCHYCHFLGCCAIELLVAKWIWLNAAAALARQQKTNKTGTHCRETLYYIQEGKGCCYSGELCQVQTLYLKMADNLNSTNLPQNIAPYAAGKVAVEIWIF